MVAMLFNERLHFQELKDTAMRGRADGQSYICVTTDIGNGTITAITPDGIITFPHAIQLLEPADLDDIESQGASAANLYFANGRPYLLGDAVSSNDTGKYAVRMGTERYDPEYIGGLLAIVLFNGLGKGYDHIHLMVNHPPSHSHYREEIITATEGTFIVENEGKVKEFHVEQTACYSEPKAGYLWALMNPANAELAKQISTGRWLVVDIGAFTTDLTLVIDGRPQINHGNNQSLRYGMIDTLNDFERTMRLNERQFFRHIQVASRDVVREAFAFGEFNGGGYGNLPVFDYATSAGKKSVKKILQGINALVGGIGQIDGIVLSGGGGAQKALGEFFNDDRMNEGAATREIYFGQLPIIPADSNDAEMHLVTVRGANQLQKLMKSRGHLWRQ